MYKLWEFEGDAKKRCVTRNEEQEKVFKARGFECLGEVDKKTFKLKKVEAKKETK